MPFLYDLQEETRFDVRPFSIKIKGDNGPPPLEKPSFPWQKLFLIGSAAATIISLGIYDSKKPETINPVLLSVGSLGLASLISLPMITAAAPSEYVIVNRNSSLNVGRWVEEGFDSSLEKDVADWHFTGASWSWAGGGSGTVLHYKIQGLDDRVSLYLKEHQTIYGRVALCHLKQLLNSIPAVEGYIILDYEIMKKLGACNIYVDCRYKKGAQTFFWHHNLTEGESYIPINQETNIGGSNRGEAPPIGDGWTIEEIAFGIEGWGDPIPNDCEAETVCNQFELHLKS